MGHRDTGLSVIPALRGLRQKDSCKFKSSLGYKERGSASGKKKIKSQLDDRFVQIFHPTLSTRGINK